MDPARVAGLERLFKGKTPTLELDRKSTWCELAGEPWTGVTDGCALALLRGSHQISFATGHQTIGPVLKQEGLSLTLCALGDYDVDALRQFLAAYREHSWFEGRCVSVIGIALDADLLARALEAVDARGRCCIACYRSNEGLAMVGEDWRVVAMAFRDLPPKASWPAEEAQP